MAVDREYQAGHTTLYDFAGGMQPVYVGEAVPGTGTGVAKWRIQRRTYSSNKLVAIEWAAGQWGFNQIWDDRASLSYS